MTRLGVILLLCVGTGFLSWPSATYAAPAPDFDFSGTARDIKNTAVELWSDTKNLFKEDTTQQTTPCTPTNGSWECSDQGTKVSKPSTFSKGLTLLNGFGSYALNETKNFFNPKPSADNPKASWWTRFKGQFSKDDVPARIEENIRDQPKYKRAALPCRQGAQTASDIKTPCSLRTILPNME